MKTKVLMTVCVMLAGVLMISAIVCGKQENEEKAPDLVQTEKAEAEVQAKAEEEAKAKEEAIKVEEKDPVVTTKPADTVKTEVTPEVAKPEVKPETSPESEKPTESKPPVKSQEPAQSAKPVVPEQPAHQHNWVPVTVHHEENGHYEKTYEERNAIGCGCGQVFFDNESYKAHGPEGPKGMDGCMQNSWTMTEKVETGSTWVVDQPAWDEVVGYNCECGATK